MEINTHILMVKINFTLFAILFLIIACSIKTKEIPVITPQNVSENKIRLTEFATDISYIQLNNKILLSAIKDVKKISEGFLVKTNDGLFLYDETGDVQHQIGKKGKGPGEYSFVNDFTFNHTTEEIYILNGKKVLVYNIKGILQYSFEAPDKQSFENIICFNEKLFFPKSFGFGGLKNEWYSTNTLGELISQKQNYILGVNPMVKYRISQVFSDGESIFYWNQLNDTIFQINDQIKPTFLFAQDKFRITAKDLASADNYRNKASWQLITILGTKRFLFFDYLQIKDGLKINTLYDKNENTMYKMASSDLDGESTDLNDFDNGPAIVPVSTYISGSEEYLLGWVNSFHLKIIVNSDAFKNSIPKFPEKKKELEKLANSLNENDNPVLMLVKLKE